MMGKRLIIIDSNSIIHRAFHALPPLTTQKGELVNAIYGFLLVFFKAIRDFQPDYVVACFDYPAPTFRHKKFKEYKAKRPPTPKELYDQIPKFQTFYHIDCYRIERPKEILDLGFKEIIQNPKNIIVIEWADRIRKILPKNILILKFEFIDKNKRKIKCTR